MTKEQNNHTSLVGIVQVGEKFRTRSLKFPGFISGCTMDWFSRWPRDALVAVSQHFLTPFPIVCSPRTKDQLVHLMGSVHDDVVACCTDYFDRCGASLDLSHRCSFSPKVDAKTDSVRPIFVTVVMFVFCRFRRQTHVTPKSYLAFIDGYKSIYTQKHKSIGDLCNKMNTGEQPLSLQ